MTRAAALAIVGIVFVLKAAHLLTVSAVVGRLAMPAAYDDIVYFTLAAQYLNALTTQGMTGLIQYAFGSPPHSPGSTLLALVGLYVTGGARWAAYSMNVVAAFGIFTAATWRFRPAYVAVLGLVLAVLPLFDKIVTTFHPDLLTGFFAGASCLLLVQGRFADMRTRYLVVTGALAAAAFLMKPVAVPLLVPLFAGGLAGVLFIASREGGLTRQIWRNVLVLAAAFLICGGWWIPVRLLAILNYLWLGFVSQQDVWRVDMTLWQHVEYYPRFMAEMLGTLFWPALALVAAAFAGALLYRRGDLLVRLSLLLVVCGMSWFFPTIVTSAKTFFFGGVLYGTVFWLVAYSGWLVYQFAEKQPVRRAIATTAVVVVALLGVKTNQDVIPKDLIVQSREVFEKAAAEVRLRPWAEKLFLAQVTIVPTAAFTFQFALEGRDVKAPLYVYKSDLQYLLKEMNEADIVGLQDSSTIGPGPKFPVNEYLDKLVAEARASKSLRLVDEIRVTNGSYYIFARQPPLTQTYGEGWGRLEGPYPEWNLDLVRWMEQNATVDISGVGDGTLKLKCRLEAGATIKIKTAGGAFTHAGTGEFEDMNVKVSAGETVTLTVDKAASKELAMLCEEPEMIW